MFVRFKQTVYFRANDGEHGVELWRTDGTAAGTSLVADLFRGPLNGVPGNLAVAGGSLYSHAFTEPTGSKVFRSDGTQMVMDINPVGSSNPSRFTRLGKRVVFAADDGKNGNEVWVSDGTPAGTQLLKDVNAGAANSSPLDLVAAGGLLFFTAITDLDEATGTVRTQLWITDGTGEGTKLVWEAPGRSRGYTIRNVTLLGQQLLFSGPTAVDAEGLSANIELYRLDVSAAKSPGSEGSTTSR